MDKQFLFSSQNDIQILRVSDLLNELENKEIMRAVEAKIADGFPNFVVDLSGMNFMNSVGINFLIQVKHRSKASGGRVVVLNASPKVKQLLEITKLRPMFNLTDSLDDALEFLEE